MGHLSREERVEWAIQSTKAERLRREAREALRSKLQGVESTDLRRLVMFLADEGVDDSDISGSAADSYVTILEELERL